MFVYSVVSDQAGQWVTLTFANRKQSFSIIGNKPLIDNECICPSAASVTNQRMDT